MDTDMTVTLDSGAVQTDLLHVLKSVVIDHRAWPNRVAATTDQQGLQTMSIVLRPISDPHASIGDAAFVESAPDALAARLSGRSRNPPLRKTENQLLAYLHEHCRELTIGGSVIEISQVSKPQAGTTSGSVRSEDEPGEQTQLSLLNQRGTPEFSRDYPVHPMTFILQCIDFKECQLKFEGETTVRLGKKIAKNVLSDLKKYDIRLSLNVEIIPIDSKRKRLVLTEESISTLAQSLARTISRLG